MAYHHANGYKKLDEANLVACADIVRENAEAFATEPDDFDYRNLPAGQSWNLVSSLFYQDSDHLADLCADARVGWAFEDLFPHDLVEDLDPVDDGIHVGSVEGWIAN